MVRFIWCKLKTTMMFVCEKVVLVLLLLLLCAGRGRGRVVEACERFQVEIDKRGKASCKIVRGQEKKRGIVSVLCDFL